MKSFLRIACVLLCVLIITGCTNTEKYPWNLTEADSVYENASEDVSIELRPENLTTKQGWFIMRNRGNLYVRFDSSFYLLVKKNGTWHHMDADTAVLTQYETKVDSINGYYNYYFDWEPVYGELPKGTYRLVGTYRIGKQEDTHTAWCTFEITSSTPKEDQYGMYDTKPAIYVNDRLYSTAGPGMKDLDFESLMQIGVIERNVMGCNTPNENFHANSCQEGTPIYQWNDMIIIYDGETFWPYETEGTDPLQ